MSLLLKLARLSPSDYLLIGEVYFLLYLSKWYIECRSFKEILQWIGREDLKGHSMTEAEMQFSWKVATYTQSLSRFVLYRSKCYDRALTVKKILNRHNIPSELMMGVRTDEREELKAHAWIRCNNRSIIGGSVAKVFTPVRSFF